MFQARYNELGSYDCSVTDAENSYFPGKDLGLPFEGPGSIAKMGRRVVALFVDYTAASLIAAAFFGYRQFVEGQSVLTQFTPLIIFAVINIVFIPTILGTPGHRIMQLRVMRVDGAWPGFWRPIIRTALLVIVIPAVIWDQDRRGLHDKFAGTVLVRA